MSRSKRNAAAEDYFRRAPGYSAEAIPGLLRRADEHERLGRASCAAILRRLACVLEAGHKFALPEDGKLFDHSTPSMVDTFRLPFSECVFECHVDFNPIVEDTLDPERTVRGEGAVIIAAVERDGVVVLFPIVQVGESWALQYWFPKIDTRAFKGYRPSDTPTGMRVLTNDKTASGLRFADRPISHIVYQGVSFARFGEVADEFVIRHNLTDDGVNVRAMVTVGSCVDIVVQACAALACTNVTTEVLRPNREARAARPASTLFDYHVLMIDPGKERNPSEPLGGTHASPRTHLRRGHIRRLAWGPRIWVNSCVVNPSAIGTVNKDYVVRAVSH